MKQEQVMGNFKPGDYCHNCSTDLIPSIDCVPDLSTLDRDSFDTDGKCSRCRAEEEHDFTAMPKAEFNRIGKRIK
jgi:hypothetical protein